MKLKFFLLFAFYTLFFLFYPGNSYYFHIFAYNRAVFTQKEKKINLKINPVPYLKFNYYPEVSAQGVYVVDLPLFTPLMERNANQHFLPASTTKIITALVAFDIYQPEQIITVKNPTNEGQVMGLVPGEKITVENLLYGILVHSANDAAYALAENFGFEKFINSMNKKAKDLKMNNSYFVNPAGYDDSKQTTTPYDLALAARALLANKYLAKIAATKEIIISDVDFKIFHKLSNVNKLLGEVQGIGGLKTGYTENARENLVSFYKKNGHQFIVVILKSQDRFQDTKNIINWINENIDYLNPKL
ncbi:MAG: D-alanyl-D-alanine carboxypeptidase family protein [Microgenomates group bacterium]